MNNTQTHASHKMRNRKQLLTKKQQSIVYDHSMIENTFSKIKTNFHSLQQKYVDIADKNQNYLLAIYLKVLDKVLDQVVYQQQKLNLIDCQAIKDQKCVKYSFEIVKYRDQCYEFKQMLDKKTEQLKKQQQITDQLENQINQLKILCDKKDNEIFKINNSIKHFSFNNLSNRKKIDTIPQNAQKQQQNPQFNVNKVSNQIKNTLKMRRRLSLEQQKFGNKTNLVKKLQVSPQAKSCRQKLQKTNEIKNNNSSTADSARLKDCEELFPGVMQNFDKLAFNKTAYNPKFYARLEKTQMSKRKNKQDTEKIYQELFQRKKFIKIEGNSNKLQ